MKTVTALVAAFTIACTTPNPQAPAESCEVSCTEDSECPTGQTCGELGMCTAGEACEVGTCTPGEFLGCGDDNTARVCDETGTAVVSEACSFGCNADAQRCNECTPGAKSCENDVLQSCSPEGIIEASETCALGCSDTAATDPHCRHISPAWIPTACDARATAPALELVQTTINTDNDTLCTGGIVQQTAPAGPEICVVRHSTIAISGEVIVTGRRAIAFVADHALEVKFAAWLDVGGSNGANGPGGGFTVSGAAPLTGGGGGAGFHQIGAGGGGIGEFGTGGTMGGATFNPLTKGIFEGGARATSAASNGAGNYRPSGGGGGGALMLVSCEGTVTIDGLIDAGGGGGQGGGDTANVQNGTRIVAAAGGGAGGYIVLQGAQVAVHGEMYANGGGGGGGCATDECIGPSGMDGAVSGLGGTGGRGATSTGGIGGHGANPPTVGGNAMTASPGGGGGSTGRCQVYTPDGVTPSLTPSMVQPAFEPNRNIAVL